MQNLLRLDAERRELRVRQLDENLLLLLADEVDFRHAGNPQDLGADSIAEILQVAILETIAGDRKDVRVRVAEFVIEVGPLDPRRQRPANVADFLAHLVPGLRHLRRGRRIPDGEKDHRFAGLRVAADEIDVGHFLQLALDLVGDLLLDFACRRACPLRLDHHHLERERRVLGLSQPLVRHHTDERAHDDCEDDQRTVPKCPFGKVEARGKRVERLIALHVRVLPLDDAGTLAGVFAGDVLDARFAPASYGRTVSPSRSF